MKEKNQKTKVLAIGDIHGDTNLVKQIEKKSKNENIKLIIIAGDLTFAEKSLKNLIGPFLENNRKILLIPGNHESETTVEFLSRKYKRVHNLHQEPFIHKKTGFFGSGTVDWGIKGNESYKLFKELEKSHNKIKDLERKIMITHMHPMGSDSEISGFQGSYGVFNAIEKFTPEILINSHIHEMGGLQERINETMVVNVSRNPFIFEI